MAMPDNLVLVRHGESEANIVQGILYGDDESKKQRIKNIVEYHDAHIRLTPSGAKQAKAAGEWLKNNNLLNFDRYYVSPHIRTRETAANLSVNGSWHVDDRLREQDWGEYNLLSWDEIQADSPASRRIRDQNYWYWRPRGGETLAGDVRTRFESFLTTLHRKAANKQVIGVTHGGYMQTARFVLERLTPDQWVKQVETPEYKLSNCQILHYTRINPTTGEKDPYLRWRRSICPWDERRSWNNGEWIEINTPTYNDQELLQEVEKYKRLLPNDLLES